MRDFFVAVMVAGLMSSPALAADAPRFDNPRDLLETVYEQIEAQDWDSDSHFDERDLFSASLKAQLADADQEQIAQGNEMGALDFSPFIDGQDAGGMKFEIGEPDIRGNRAVAEVRILNSDDWLLYFDLIDEKKAGWKVADIMASRDGQKSWQLTELLADPSL